MSAVPASRLQAHAAPRPAALAAVLRRPAQKGWHATIRSSGGRGSTVRCRIWSRSGPQPGAGAAAAAERGVAALPPAGSATASSSAAVAAGAPGHHDDDPNERDVYGQTALMRAALNGNAARAQQLLQRGADPSAQDAWGTSALMLAAGRGHAAVVRALLQHGAQVDARDSCGRTALMAAALSGAYTHMANSALARSYGFSSAGAMESTQALLEAGADVAVQDEAGFTPLERLAQGPVDFYAAGTARLLLAAGADGGPALAAALREENLPALDALIAAGVDASALLEERLEFTRAHRRSADDALLLMRAGAPLAGLPDHLKQLAVDLALRPQ